MLPEWRLRPALSRYGPEHPDLDAPRDLDMAEHRQGGIEALDDHAHIGPRVRRGDEHEALAGLQMLADRVGGILPELLKLARVDVELADFTLAVTLEALVKGEVPAVAEPQHLEHASLGEVAADLLRHADTHMLDDLLGAAHMRGDLGDGLDDEVQVADRYALGQQQLQHGLQARIGNVRGAYLVGKLAVFRVLPLQQRLHVLVGQKLRQVV